ncbi:MAG: hypothetical protein WDM79_15480 [Terricaulis sp.]
MASCPIAAIAAEVGGKSPALSAAVRTVFEDLGAGDFRRDADARLERGKIRGNSPPLWSRPWRARF